MKRWQFWAGLMIHEVLAWVFFGDWLVAMYVLWVWFVAVGIGAYLKERHPDFPYSDHASFRKEHWEKDP